MLKQIRNKMLKVLWVLGMVFIFCYGMYYLAIDSKRLTIEKYEQVKNEIEVRFFNVRQEVAAEEQTLTQIVDNLSYKYNINPMITRAIIKKESDYRWDAIRYEQTWKNQYSRKWPRRPGENDYTHNMLFHSIGLMQIGYGLHRNFCDLTSYADLFDPKVNIECGLKIISKCLEDNSKIKSRGDRVRYCIKRFNGTGPRAESYADSVLSMIATNILESENTFG